MKEASKKVISITVTEGCNLDCIYCYEDYKSRRCMSKEVLIGIIDKELSSIPKDFLLQVEFMGGEPFMNYELIHYTVEYYKQTEDIKIGDMTPFDGITREEKRLMGKKAVEDTLAILKQGAKYQDYIEEFEQRITKEAKFAYLCDKMDSDLQAKKYSDADFACI